MQLARERKLPFVALDLASEDGSVATIGIDNVAGAAMAARHLIDLGHRRFAVLALQFVDGRTGPVSPEQVQTAVYAGTRDRLTGYFQELSRVGVDTSKVPVYETANDATSTIAALEAIFGVAEPPTAILAMSDRMALVALEWLSARKLKVPDDISIVGFDGVPEAAVSEPPLTTVAQPIAEIGRLAVKAILENDGTTNRRQLPVELIVRASSASPRG